jgi:outer membrane murein-binding lipoprotein Lpp
MKSIKLIICCCAVLSLLVAGCAEPEQIKKK